MITDGLAVLIRTMRGLTWVGCVPGSGPTWEPPPQDTRGWGYFGGSGRNRSVPLVGLRSGVPGAFCITTCT
jgi:hypothetical protein